MKTLWKIARWTSILALALGLLLVLFGLEENWRGHRAWENYRHELEAVGFRFGIDEIHGSEIPDAQNFGSTPVLQPLFRYVLDEETGFYRLRDPKAPEHLTPPSVSLHALREPVLWQTGQLALVNEATARKIIQFLHSYASTMETVALATQQRPLVRYRLVYEEGVSMPFSHLSVFQSLVSAYLLRADAELALNENDLAWSDLQTSLRLSRLSGTPSLWLPHLVRISMLMAAMEPLRTGLHLHAWNDQQLRTLQSEFAEMHLFAEWEQAIHGEMAALPTTVEKLEKSAALRRRAAHGLSENESALADFWSAFPISGWIEQNLVFQLHQYREISLKTFSAAADRVFPQNVKREKESSRAVEWTPYQYMVKESNIVGLNVTRRTAIAAQEVHFAELACALERFRLRYRQEPVRLIDLVPVFIPKLPLDVCNGEPLQYRLEASGYRIWSVGWNAKDDGGNPGLTSAGGIDYEKGDWVWIMSGAVATAAAK